MGFKPPSKPNVTLKVEEKPINFLVDTGAKHSVLAQPHGKLSSKKSWVQVVIGMNQDTWTTQRTVDLGMSQAFHSFMVIPDCPYPLLGRDLLTKIGAQISFDHKGTSVTDPRERAIHISTLSLEDKYRLHQRGSCPEWDLNLVKQIPLGLGRNQRNRVSGS